MKRSKQKSEGWDLYPGNEAGAFDHLDNAPTKQTPLPSIHEEGKFTKGEWKVSNEAEPDLTIWSYLPMEGGSILNECVATIWANSNTEANAALIAEAKNMYLALKELQKYFYAKYANSGESAYFDIEKVESILNRIK